MLMHIRMLLLGLLVWQTDKQKVSQLGTSLDSECLWQKRPWKQEIRLKDLRIVWYYAGKRYAQCHTFLF